MGSDFDRIQNENNYYAMKELTKELRRSNNPKKNILSDKAATVITILGISLLVIIYLI